MFWCVWLLQPLLLQILSILPSTFALGKGPVGIYAINDQYALVADSYFQALLIVDVKWGGTVSILRLFRPKNDGSPSKRNMNPTGVASCDTCHYAYISTSSCQNFFEVNLFLWNRFTQTYILLFLLRLFYISDFAHGINFSLIDWTF